MQIATALAWSHKKQGKNRHAKDAPTKANVQVALFKLILRSLRSKKNFNQSNMLS